MWCEKLGGSSVFTFQYVSINTDMLNQGYVQLPEFTFQYVSINTTTHSI